MLHIKHIIQKQFKAIMLLAFVCVATQSYGQDTLAGNYPLLTIKSGNHVIKNVVTVKGRLDIEAGARIELIETGVIVCEGAVNIKGELNNKIEFFGKSNVMFPNSLLLSIYLALFFLCYLLLITLFYII